MAQDGLKWPKIAPTWPKKAPKRTQNGPRRPQKCSNKAPKSLYLRSALALLSFCLHFALALLSLCSALPMFCLPFSFSFSLSFSFSFSFRMGGGPLSYIYQTRADNEGNEHKLTIANILVKPEACF